MIEFQGVSKDYSGQTVLSDASFQVNPGEHVGIVGPNGAGKTTIFGMIVGEVEPDKGRVSTPTNPRMGYVRQQLNSHAVDATLLEYVEGALPELGDILREIHELDAGLSALDASARATALRRVGELQTRFEAMGGYTVQHRAEQALSGLGFPVADFAQPFRSFSGGWQSRAELARILVAEPDILFLDEPSNYLDNPTIEWLQKYLREFHGTLLLISHDRFLLNSLTSVTVEVANGRVEKYPGNYDYYVQEREKRYEQRLAAQKNQDRKREHLERFIERFRAKSTLATQAQSRVKQLARMEKIDVPRVVVSPGRIRLRPPPHCGAEVMRLEDGGITYDGSRWVLRNVDLRIMRGEKIALVGYNGLGKTTLLRILAGKLPLSEGKRVEGHRVQIGYQSQDFAETMDPSRTVFHTVKSVGADVPDQEVRTLLGGFGFSGDAVEKTVQVLSGGEKIRLALARLLVKPPNFLVLDEPTTHLDVQAREALERALREFEGTICMVSHDIEFLRNVADHIVAMTPPGITRYVGGYDYYHEKRTSNQPSVSSDQKSEAGGQKSNAAKRDSRLGGRDMPSAKLDKKELRRQRAEIRQAAHGKTRDLRRTIRKAEQEVERLEAEKADLTANLSAPRENTNFASLSRRLKEVQYEIDIATVKWEQATEELEKVRGG